MLNKVMLIGRLGRDPEVKHFDNENAVANFTVATNEVRRDKDGNKIETTEWHNIVIWRKGLVGVVEQYLKKGQQVYLEGKLRTRSWDDKDGNKRYTTEVVCDEMKFLDRPGESTAANPAPAQAASTAPVENGGQEADDLPF